MPSYSSTLSLLRLFPVANCFNFSSYTLALDPKKRAILFFLTWLEAKILIHRREIWLLRRSFCSFQWLGTGNFIRQSVVWFNSVGLSHGGKPLDKSSPCSRAAGAEREWPLSMAMYSAQALPPFLLQQVDHRENYLSPLRHLGFFLPFPKKRQDESGLENISFTVLYVTAHTQKNMSADWGEFCIKQKRLLLPETWGKDQSVPA